ncbi:MAG: HYR domain-containing protein [Chryseolinea sp.]
MIFKFDPLSECKSNHINDYAVARLLCSILLICLFSFKISAQTVCDCPKPPACKPCSGGITSLTLKYNGTFLALVSVRDKGVIIYTKFLAAGEVFTVVGQELNGKFDDKEVEVLIVGFVNTVIDVKCPLALDPTEPRGKFFLIAAESRNNGPLCCSSTADDESPVITNCLSDIISTVSDNTCSKNVSWTEPIATDCNLKSFVSNKKPGDSFPLGITTVTYTATDESNNIATCGFMVTIKDEEPPVITQCPEDIMLRIPSSEPSAINWTAPVASDNCALENLQSTHTPGDLFPLGTTLVTYTANDKSGNMVECSFSILLELSGLDLDIEKIVTPSGQNNKWHIGNIDKYETNKVVVVDRWGSVVYRGSDYDNNLTIWDGQQNGRILPTGTYFYSISVLQDHAWIEEKGFIELVR